MIILIKNNTRLMIVIYNPIFLNVNMFIFYEVKFVKCDDGTYFISNYSLSDFSTSRKNCVHKFVDLQEYKRKLIS